MTYNVRINTRVDVRDLSRRLYRVISRGKLLPFHCICILLQHIINIIIIIHMYYGHRHTISRCRDECNFFDSLSFVSSPDAYLINMYYIYFVYNIICTLCILNALYIIHISPIPIARRTKPSNFFRIYFVPIPT